MIELQDVHKRFGGEAAAVAGVSLTVARGEIFGVIGRSGAGKSTLIRLVNLLERPSAGRVLIDGQDVTALEGEGLRALRRRIGMIFQQFGLLGSRSVAENVALPMKLAGDRSGAEIKARVAALLERVGLADHARKYPAQLSGGQKQRVGIARALATDPAILLCDEATSALDPETTRSILALLDGLNRELGLTILLITHEMDVVRDICDRVAVLDRGRVVEIGAVADLFLKPSHPVTRALIAEAEHRETPVRQAGGRRVRVTLTGAAAETPFLTEATRGLEVDLTILDGRIGRTRDRPYSQLLLAVGGRDAEQALARLAACAELEELAA
ncbi:methionine ABC transporter ATP-binding protein [Sphingomonas oleivorans]|uniref:Cell division ATP-binding protein FtsE n=1 Tax=Sphingomonas oleivorans TaxID=1735121 RepID=A0A2T5FYF0_9SPHN|nr:ATP-binding cassette domain-containing protein [Sphingomonas oleivorans]PTQ11560.1 methionine ABC transporter ATP-binding protein [Sphingomonas oleivorans]